MPYPTEITQEVLGKLAHIPTSTVEQDLRDAKAELSQKETDAMAQSVIANNHRPGNDLNVDYVGKMAYFRQRAYEAQCDELRDQIAFFERLLAKRKEQ